jgi:hypothetical protein
VKVEIPDQPPKLDIEIAKTLACGRSTFYPVGPLQKLDTFECALRLAYVAQRQSQKYTSQKYHLLTVVFLELCTHGLHFCQNPRFPPPCCSISTSVLIYRVYFCFPCSDLSRVTHLTCVSVIETTNLEWQVYQHRR